MSLLGLEIILKFPFWTFWSLPPKAKLHSSLASFSYFVVSGVKSSRSSVSVAAAKRRPFSAHSLTAQPKTWNKSPPAFDSNNTAAKRQLDVIERDLNRTTKALQDRLGISKQGFVWNQREKNVFLQNERSTYRRLSPRVSIMTDFICHLALSDQFTVLSKFRIKVLPNNDQLD